MIPKQYQRFLDKGPIRAKVMLTFPDGTVLISAGQNDGATKGTRLAIESFGWLELEVENPSCHTAIARPWYFEGSDKLVKQGQAFTSGEEYFRVEPSSEKRFAKKPPVKPPSKN